jgi:hypothetical protein
MEESMSGSPCPISDLPALRGSEGELISLRITIDPRQLEELLDCLSQLSFPINPQIYHAKPTVVEFPAYQNRLKEVSDALRAYGFAAAALQLRPMLQAISAA